MAADNLMFRDDLLKDARVLVTGGGTGLGREMAEAMLKLGAEVIICGRRGAVVEETAQELVARHGGKMTGYACDIRDPEAIEALVETIWSQHGPLTGLVNNAAGNFISRTEDLSVRGFDAIADIVFRGTFYMTLTIGKRWIAEKRPGSVISILTTWVWNGSPFTVPSAMSKSGIRAMTESLAVEWGRHGIRFNAIAPGAFPTKGAWERLSPGKGADGDDFREQVPMGRVGQMHEIANLACFLMGPGAEYVTAQTIAIDGGVYNATGGNFWGLRTLGDEQWEAIRTMIKSANAKDKAKRSA